MEAPEKIYLSQERDEDRCYVDLMWHKHPYKNMENTEYVRKDAFVKKILNFLEMLGYGFTITDNITHTNYDKEQLIEDFKKYIEE